jgi:hypothetical protein
MDDCPNDTSNGYGSHNTTHPLPCPCCDKPHPVAWWSLAENGNIRCWTSAHAESLRLANEVGFDLEPLYDQAALDAAVAAALERRREYDDALLAAEREWWERTAEAMAQEADRKFPLDGTVAIWLRALLAKRGA